MAMITYTNGKKRYGNAEYSSSGKGKEEALLIIHRKASYRAVPRLAGLGR
jgi:hypothetical protein